MPGAGALEINVLRGFGRPVQLGGGMQVQHEGCTCGMPAHLRTGIYSW